MSQRGVYFALALADVEALRGAIDDAALLAVVQDEIEERWDERWLFQTDTGWAAIHRCLTDGQLASDGGRHPLSACVLGGEQLYRGDDFIVSFLGPAQVADVAAALVPVDKEWLRARYDAIDSADYGMPTSDEDFEYVWSCFAGLPEFFGKAASAGRAMIFTVDL